MVHAVTSSGASLLGRTQQRTADVEAIATLARLGIGSRVVSATVDGASVANDRMLVARSIGLAAEAAGLAAGAANARKAASFLQAADSGLASIADKLTEMKALVETITESTNPATSAADRAILDNDFAALRADIDDIAQRTSFDGTKLLQGDGGGALQIAFRVGSGISAEDDITISIDGASASDLAAGLATDSLATTAGATTALVNVTAATDKLNDIRAAVAGSQQRVYTAAENADDTAGGHNKLRIQQIDVEVTVEQSRLLGQEIAHAGGVKLTDSAAAVLRQLLLADTNDGNAAADDGGNTAPAPSAKKPDDTTPA